ncbi:MAG: YjjW family glycine radical enzyme activase [Tepidibacter sp.]|jgi:YjjW family glycine radical enzyme activase|uniref:YjjW family glycine radical enzyme activase n=1 Tax=Tepidibacter sp. TaxID=2529387 RepID=UPI0025DFE1D5|nr:YjjW family glycine radical enzyme activase [Tepidibacter sp.]MCT4507186.1 YjjW family glycine radical enzyme activase [Tepidibacter sp.]
MCKGLVNRILPFSSVDGPGNRSVIFMQGCNFNCLYCHNPETINICNNCGKCIGICPNKALKFRKNIVEYDSSLCTQCGLCLKACDRNSDPRANSMSVEDILNKINKVKNFVSGVTVSGGECTMNLKFLLELGERVKEIGLSYFIDTNGSISLKNHLKFVDVVDKFMLDVKSFDKKEHIKLTGQDNTNVLENLKFLLEKDKLYEVRTVIVPEVLNNKNNVDNVSKIIAKYNTNVRYKLIKYRQLGVRQDKLISYTPGQNLMEEYKEIVTKNGCKNVVII